MVSTAVALLISVNDLNRVNAGILPPMILHNGRRTDDTSLRTPTLSVIFGSAHPIPSQLSGNAESLIYDNDILFATSSLEVGFDDPDMMMVYQHYAPTNLASFIQRKGRGGRGSDDRPITGVTLSLFSPTDSWYFRYPERMLDAKSFHIPINVQNFFVRRGQVLSQPLMFYRRIAIKWFNNKTKKDSP